MTPDRPEKKSETMRVRVPFSLKRRFLAKAEREGRTASEIFRDLMEDYLRRPARRTAGPALANAFGALRRRPRPAFAAILGAAGISALLAGTIPAGAAPDLRAAFERMDADGDGAIAREEYLAAFRGSPAESEIPPQQARRPDPPADWPPPPLDGPHSYVALPLVRLKALGKSWIFIPVPGLEGATPSPLPVGSPPPPPEPPETIRRRDFMNMDADADRTLTFEEFAAPQEAIFNRSFAYMDTNEDGVVDAEEIRALDALSDTIGEYLEPLDADGDGRITRAEYDAEI